MAVNVRTQASVERDERTFMFICAEYCHGRADAEKAKSWLNGIGYGSAMSERHINSWAEKCGRELPFSVRYIRGGAL